MLTLVGVTSVLLTIPVLLFAGSPPVLTIVGALVAAAFVGARRESLHAVAALGIIVVLWMTADPAATSPWSLVLAVLLLGTHSAVALRSSVPPGAPLDRVVVRRWARRGLAVCALTGLVYVVGLAVHHLHRGDNPAVVVATLSAARWADAGATS